jgi:class 3 adenylate cyclase
MSDRPSGTVTFLFTDIEGSTRLWEERPDEMRTALAEHDALVRAAIESHGGYVFSTGGDGFASAFSRAADAGDAARKAQASLAGPRLSRVRMGMHTGEVEERDGDYFGPAVNRAARIMAAGHGGQLLVSAATSEILGRDAELTSLGEHRLRDLSTPERVFQLGAGEFPRLRSLDSYPGNLPLQLSSFVGRERELEQVVAAVRDKPLVTLTGAGGVGKTRLAVHVAAELVPQFVGGAWLVELGSISDPDAVPQVIASTLGLRQRDGMTLTQSLVEYLNARSALIILDNCEHLLDAASAVSEADATSGSTAGIR